MDFILYHGKCLDGFCAAFIASKKFPKAELVPLEHGAEFDFERFRDKDVLMVDFSLRTRADNVKLAEIAKSFLILDHHKSASAELEGLLFVVLDMGRSGAGIVWDYFNFDVVPIGEKLPNGRTHVLFQPKPRPWYVDYVENYDLWRHSLPNSKEVSVYLRSLSTEDWEPLDALKDYTNIVPLGAAILKYVNRYVEETVAEAQYGRWGEHTVGVVNVPCMNVSEIGHALAEKADIGMAWFERHDGMIQFSLRSVGDVDVSTLAKSKNGGGHQNASGFQLPRQEAHNLINSILGRP